MKILIWSSKDYTRDHIQSSDGDNTASRLIDKLWNRRRGSGRATFMGRKYRYTPSEEYKQFASQHKILANAYNR